jgi:glucose-1-phosphate adenylyltransferase
VYQNLHHIENHRAEKVCIFGGDHIYRMDVRQMGAFHEENDADVTVAAIPQPVEHAHFYGIITANDDWRMIDFEEKPKSPKPMPGDPTKALCSMGIYIFNTDILSRAVREDAQRDDSEHDFGKNIIPSLFKKAKVMVYNFLDNDVSGVAPREKGYWRDVGSIDQYWQASMDLVSVSPIFNLYNNRWPIHTARDINPPAKFVFADEESDRIGMATDSMVCDGVIISGGRINRSILSPNVRINSYSQVDESILFDNVNVGRHCKIKRAIIDKDVEIPPNTVIGYEHVQDRKRFHVSPEGIVVIPKRAVVHHEK